MKFNSLIVFTVFFISCGDGYTPKPRAFFKIDLPNKDYIEIKVKCPFVFEKPIYSVLEKKQQEYFYDLNFPKQNGVLHITYLPLNDNLQEHIETSRALALKHIIVADGVKEDLIINKLDNVYGILYDYKGMTATSTQFYLTDSINHFFRGALYFNTEISDSLLPVNNFLKQDVKHIIESFRWINQ